MFTGYAEKIKSQLACRFTMRQKGLMGSGFCRSFGQIPCWSAATRKASSTQCSWRTCWNTSSPSEAVARCWWPMTGSAFLWFTHRYNDAIAMIHLLPTFVSLPLGGGDSDLWLFSDLSDRSADSAFRDDPDILSHVHRSAIPLLHGMAQGWTGAHESIRRGWRWLW